MSDKASQKQSSVNSEHKTDQSIQDPNAGRAKKERRLNPQTWRKSTIGVRAGLEADENFNAVMPPLYTSTNYAFSSFGEVPHFDYGRLGNPTREILGQALADMEGGFGGIPTASGMAALDLAFHMLDPGDHIVAPHDCYGGTYRLLKSKSDKGHYTVHFIDQTDKEALREALEKKPKMILIETPSNPLLRIVDLEHACDLAKQNGTIVLVDNTFLSPILQSPIDFGADMVVHSTTKYINGHSDVIGGVLISKTQEMHEKMQWWYTCIGYTASPFDSYLTLRGVRTLEARIMRQQETAHILAERLNQHKAVEKVYYPGLQTHPGHDLATRQQRGFGAMISFEIKGGVNAVKTMVDHLEIFSLAESLGGVESLICHPVTMTHREMGPAAHKEAGLSQGLLRISAGQENADDLADALDDALGAIA